MVVFEFSVLSKPKVPELFLPSSNYIHVIFIWSFSYGTIVAHSAYADPLKVGCPKPPLWKHDELISK
jgi:hypothetical protein